MKTDRELLELAAKACGYDAEWHHDGSCDLVTKKHIGNVVNHDWSPLTDDGDALRLAVRLNIHIEGYFDKVTTETDKSSFCEMYKDNPLAATRRAIVRAAASME